jgi:hypothetical protein
MAFWGKHPIRSKIVLQDQILERVSYLNYLGCEISKENGRDIDKKLGRFQMLCGTIHRTKKRNKAEILQDNGYTSFNVWK